MTHAFKTIPAKPTFGTVQPLLYQSDYLNSKKRQALANRKPIDASISYDAYLLYNPRVATQINPFNLVYNLYSQENLYNINTLAHNKNLTVPVTKINPLLKPLYNHYTIDPQGQLFGNIPCGELNYVNYMRPSLN